MHRYLHHSLPGSGIHPPPVPELPGKTRSGCIVIDPDTGPGGFQGSRVKVLITIFRKGFGVFVMRTGDCYYAVIAVMLFTICVICGCQHGTPAGDTGSVPHPASSSPAPQASSDPDEENPVGAFWDAVSKGQAERVKTLLKKKPDLLMIVDSNQNTPLHIAAQEGKHDVVEVLLKSGAKPNVQNAAGRTPLHETMSGTVAVMLVTHGADKTIKNKEGNNPVEAAKKDDKQEVLKALKAK